MTPHPAAKCTRGLRIAFERIAVGQDNNVYRPTAEKLVKLGLVESYKEMLLAAPGQPRWLDMEITRYRVPLAIHAQWCQWCSEKGES